MSAFVGEFRRRGFVVHAYGNRDLDSSFAQELQVQPLCRHVPYIRTRGESSLSCFLERSSFLYDIKSAWRLEPYEIKFFHSPLAAQFAAVGTLAAAVSTRRIAVCGSLVLTRQVTIS
jgi:hypothetical protein